MFAFQRIGDKLFYYSSLFFLNICPIAGTLGDAILRALEGELTTLEGKTIDYRGVKGNEKNTGKHHSSHSFRSDQRTSSFSLSPERSHTGASL
jgi:hypothetical protein